MQVFKYSVFENSSVFVFDSELQRDAKYPQLIRRPLRILSEYEFEMYGTLI